MHAAWRYYCIVTQIKTEMFNLQLDFPGSLVWFKNPLFIVNLKTYSDDWGTITRTVRENRAHNSWGGFVLRERIVQSNLRSKSESENKINFKNQTRRHQPLQPKVIQMDNTQPSNVTNAGRKTRVFSELAVRLQKLFGFV